MRTIFENIRLTVTTEKNVLPVGKTIFGSLKIANDMSNARFREEPYPFETILRKSIRLKHGNGFTVSFNPENNTYRITLSVHADNPDWYLLADDNFECCMDFVEKRIDN